MLKYQMGLGWEEVMAKDNRGCECYALPTVEARAKLVSIEICKNS